METIAAYGMSNFPFEMLQGFSVFHNKTTEILCQEMGLRTVNSETDFVFFWYRSNEINLLKMLSSLPVSQRVSTLKLQVHLVLNFLRKFDTKICLAV